VREKASDQLVQERAIQTRQDLLDAARRIFARDGFEVARLQDIAEAAGRTRGALYAHFKDKEDLFFALFEEDLARDHELSSRQLRPHPSREERVSTLTAQLESILQDRRRMLLYLEFKMYAIRHPHRQKRLADLHAAICDQGISNKIELLPALAIADRESRRRAVAAVGAVLDGLAINLYFDPEGLTQEEVHRDIERLVREQLTGD
jgi:AcrR family transcriptional regulator